jgi:sugar phosphate isomerase/epimerase
MQHLPLEAVLETVSDTFSHVEVICEGIHTNLEVLESYNLTVSFHAPFSDLNIASLNTSILTESLRQITENIKEAARYTVEAVCIHAGHLSPLGMRFKEKAYATGIQSLKKLAETAEEYSVSLGVENMPHFPMLLARTAEEVKAILTEVDSDTVGFTFDVGHANITGDVHQFLALKDAIRIVHLHDNHGDQDIHLALGEGSVPVDIVNHVAENLLVIEVNTYTDAVKSLDLLKKILEH